MALTYTKAPTQFKKFRRCKRYSALTSTLHGNCDAYQKVFEDVFNLQKIVTFYPEF